MKQTLAFLSSHFDALQPRAVEVEGFPFKLLYRPLNPEQSIKYVHAGRSKNPREQAATFAELLVETVMLEDGSPAFPLEAGQPAPVEILTRRTLPALYSRLVDQLGKDVNEKDVTETEKKSGPADEAGSLPSTSSPTNEDAPSPT